MSDRENNLEQILQLCLSAGNLMLNNGAETSRVEETITRIGRACGAELVHSFVTPTGIFISVRTQDGEKTGMIRIKGTASINLHKVHEVNDLSRRFERGLIDVHVARERLDEIESSPGVYRIRYQHVAAALASGSFAVLFGGSWPEFLIGSVCGWVSNTLLGSIRSDVPYFLRVFIAALVGVIIAVIGIRLTVATHMDAAIIGAVIPLVPGLSLTNSVRDLMAGELLAGLARASEAALTAFAIAVAVAVVLAFGVVPGVEMT